MCFSLQAVVCVFQLTDGGGCVLVDRRGGYVSVDRRGGYVSVDIRWWVCFS